MVKNKYLLFSAFLIIFFFLSTNSALALEVDLGLGPNPDLPHYVSFIFTWLIGIAGILSLVSFTVGAIGLINPNVEAHKEATDRMKGAVLGLVLTLASFIIINTINPALKTLNLTPLTPVVIPPPAPAPGVYYYLSPDCTGDSSAVNTYSGDYIDNKFAGKIQSVKIVNYIDPEFPENDIYYGVIFHKETGLINGGECNPPMLSPVNVQSQCLSLKDLDPAATNAADIFSFDTNFSTSPGNGVTFYSAPHGWYVGAKAGYCNIADSSIIIPTPLLNPNFAIPNIYSAINPESNDMRFDYTGVVRPPEYQKQCITFLSYSCSGSIRIKGSYLVALYSSTNTSNGVGYCQTFTKDVEDLNEQPFLASGAKMIDGIYIIPLVSQGGGAGEAETPE